MVKYCNKRYYKILIIYYFKQGVTQPEYFGDIKYRLRKSKTNPAVMRYKHKGHNINAIKQSAYIVFDTIIVDDFAFLFNCTPLGWGSDSMMGLRHKAIH